MNADKCIVTGGAGFIASHVVDLLIKSGFHVEIIDNLSTGRMENLNRQAILHQVDIRDWDRLVPVFRGARWVFHGAAWPRIQPSFDDPLTHEAINVNGTINCLILGQRWGVPSLSLRMFNVYGPRSYNAGQPNSAYSPVIGIFHHLRRAGRPLTITGSGQQSRDFVHVHDVARAFLAAAQSDVAGEVLNVGFGESHSINHIAGLMSENRVHIAERPNEAAITHADISKIQRLLGWTPLIGLEEGLSRLD